MADLTSAGERRAGLSVRVHLYEAVNDAYKEYEAAKERLQLALSLLSKKEFAEYARLTVLPVMPSEE